jgi:SNF2 family DNA or RNA helicase
MIDTTNFRNPAPLPHQLQGVAALIKHKAFFLGDRPRTMKSRQVIDAACILYNEGKIDCVVVVAPVSGRGVWGNAKLGQIKRWAWLPSVVYEFHARTRLLWEDYWDGNIYITALPWVITNYDFVRSKRRLAEFLDKLECYHSIMVVFDESKALGKHNSQQSKAAMKIREKCSRCVMLNGTPGNPEKQWSQFNILDHVLDRRYKTLTTFKWQFCKYGPREIKEIVRGGKVVWQKIFHREIGWTNLDKLSKITAPYSLMRERKDCIGLRDIKIMSSFKEVRLSEETWQMYKDLRRDALIAFGDEMYVSPHIGVRLMRLAQIVSGHLGGFEGSKVRDLEHTEKIDFLLDHLEHDCDATNVIIWCRWVREREMIAARLKCLGFIVYELYGGQSKVARREAEMIFAEGTTRVEDVRYAMLAQPQAGGMALDMSAASDVFRMSSDYNFETFAQSQDRPLGPGQQAEFVSATDIIACGPQGQRTIEHTILEAREEKRELEKMTCAEWRKELEEE